MGWEGNRKDGKKNLVKIVRKPTHRTISSTRVQDSLSPPKPTTVSNVELTRKNGVLNKWKVLYEGY